MKAVKIINKFILFSAGVLFLSASVFAQTQNPPAAAEKTPPQSKPVATERTEIASQKKPETQTAPEAKADDKTAPQSEEEAAILPYYNNYLNEYRLGPNDVITVEVFGQCPDYCIMSKTVPPNARISYPLIREGVLVAGKTVQQVADDITKKLDEYIIDPKVTVTLEKAMSARYSVLGKVAAPGVRVLDRKVSVYEAIVESGGVLKEGDKKRVIIYSYDAQGRITPKTVNLQEMERGRGEMIYLNPGDQVFVPDRGFRLNVNTVFDIISKASIVRLLFGSPF
jgi:protein involved in polysaccharide export with SLBB domain